MPTITQERSGEEYGRRVAPLPVSVDKAASSFGIIVTTETPVETWVPDPKATSDAEGWVPCILAKEVLLASGLNYSRTARMPLLDSHDSYSTIDKTLGLVEDVHVEGQSVVATARLVSNRAYMIDDIAAGFYGNVSAGYSVQKYEYSTDENGDLVATATEWTLQEASLVAIGADPYASVRSKNGPVRKRTVANTKSKERSMDLEELVTAAEDAIKAVKEAADEGASDEVVARAKALRAFGDEESEKKDETPPADNADSAEEEEKKATDEVRSLARSYGKTKLVDDMIKLGSRSEELKVALRSAIAAGAGAVTDQAVKPVVNPTPDAKRSAELASALDPTTLFARRKSGFVATK